MGCQIQVFYDNGWFTGTIIWYNQTIYKLKAMLDDRNKDYISINDTDEVRINFI